MIKLKNQIVTDEYHNQQPIEDPIRIQKALFVHRDIYCALDECGNIWQNTSTALSASWLFIPESYECIVKRIEIKQYFTSYEDLIK